MTKTSLGYDYFDRGTVYCANNIKGIDLSSASISNAISVSSVDDLSDKIKNLTADFEEFKSLILNEKCGLSGIVGETGPKGCSEQWIPRLKRRDLNFCF